MRTTALAIAALLAIALLTTAGGQGSAGNIVSRGPEAQLKSHLRNLVTAQEGFWADHGTYTTDVAQLNLFQRKRSSTDSVWVQVLFAGGRSWSGRALYLGKQPGKSCVIYVGAQSDFPSPPVSERDSVRATEEGSPVCDKF
jgi:hypothetical protein